LEKKEYFWNPISGYLTWNNFSSSITELYHKQTESINGRPYFKNEHLFGIWWGKNDAWCIGHISNKGSERCFAYVVEDVLCPHQISKNGELWCGEKMGWRDTSLRFLSVKIRYLHNQQ